MCQAALAFARRGWPVFPCSVTNKRPLVAKDVDADGQPIKGSGGVSKATVDEEQIHAWWAKWPKAMIGVAVGAAGMLVVDFDPRIDAETGEEWTLEQLKADLEMKMGCTLPATLAARTPSGGVHIYFRMPEGKPIGNRGNLPKHIDVRGLGGYVIVPPSVCEGDGKNAVGAYRWLRGDADAPIVDMPASLIQILRSPPERADRPAVDRRSSTPTHTPVAVDLDEAHRRYALRALDEEVRELAGTPPGGGRHGGRNQGAYWAAFNLGQFVGAGALSESMVRGCLIEVIRTFDQAAYSSHEGAIDNGLANGIAKPRDLSAVGARTTRGRDSDRSTSSSPDDRPSPPPAAYAADAVRAADPPTARPPSLGASQAGQSSHDGKVGDIASLSEEARARVTAMARGWLTRRIEYAEPTKDAVTRLAFAIGARVSAGLLEQFAARTALWQLAKTIADVQAEDVDTAIVDGIARGFDVQPMLLTLACVRYPLTDFGIAERFRDRFGDNYRFTTAKGWLGWDGRRWKVLDQDEKMPPAEVIAGVFETVRMLQDEGRAVADTGTRTVTSKPAAGDGKAPADDGKTEAAGDESATGHGELILEVDNPFGMDRLVPKGAKSVWFSDMIKAFGRSSETTGKPASVATLARRWLTVPIEQFDTDPLAIGVLNGTLRFERHIAADGTRTSSVVLSGHRREDHNTKLAPITYDPAATSPLYDNMLEWAQPDASMRRYLHQVGGYGATGWTVEHKLWFWYGRGRNGKSTTIDAWCHAIGDYSGTTLIETFLDQGIKKRGDQASPDMARLGGIRMLRASEPERGAKLNSALIKFVTGGEPVPTRALHRGFFDLTPQFKLIIGGNSKPEIPDTDEGIWSRMKLVSWLKNIDLEFNPDGTPKKDPDLLNKIKTQEAAGVFNRLVDGLLDYLANGLVEPAAVTADTQAYRDASDPLARFLRLCTVTEEDASVQSSKLYEVFVAWCQAVGEREWKQKGFSNAMAEKGYTKHKASGMYWLKLRLVKAVSDFVDSDGKPRDLGDADDDDDDGSRPPPDYGGDPFADMPP